MSKLGKILTFVGISGVALGGLWYFLDNVKRERELEEDFEDDEYEDEVEERSYVSLEPTAEEKEALKKVVTEAVNDMSAKAEEDLEGVGVVKEETETKDFEFKSFDNEDEENI